LSPPVLQRLAPLFSEFDGQYGDWPRERLIEINDAFVSVVERAFELGLESRAAASASVKMNGKLRADEIAIELAWRWLRENMDAGIDISFVEVVAFVQARCSGVTPARVRAGFEWRFRRARGRRASTARAAPFFFFFCHRQAPRAQN